MTRRIADHRLERSSRSTLARLGLSPHLGLDTLVTRLEERRGRELWVYPQKLLPVRITGMWLGTPERDYVWHHASLDGCHRMQVILHEFSHMIHDHRSAQVETMEWLLRVCPWISDFGDVEHVCLRSDRGSVAERQAETTASVILAGQSARQNQPSPKSAKEEQAQRLEAIFRT
jgi:hypothetical protein